MFRTLVQPPHMGSCSLICVEGVRSNLVLPLHVELCVVDLGYFASREDLCAECALLWVALVYVFPWPESGRQEAFSGPETAVSYSIDRTENRLGG